MARAKILSGINEAPHPFNHQIGQVIKEGKEGQAFPVLDKEGNPVFNREGKPKTRFEHFAPTDPRRLCTIQFGYNSICKIDMKYVFPVFDGGSK